VRGIRTQKDQETLIEDCNNYNIQILAISETHLKGNGLKEYTTKNKYNQRTTYSFFYNGNENHTHHGVGLIIEKHLKPSFNHISNRICTATMSYDNRKLVVIAGYAPTLNTSEKNPAEREAFYDELNCAIKSIAKRNICIVLGDFNAKTGSSWTDFPDNMGRYGKGHTNENGLALLEFLSKNNLILTNTLFPHKLSHRTTWTAPDRQHTSSKDSEGNKKLLLGPDGKPRRQPFRNQIDYIAIRINHRKFVTNSRSYAGIKTETDHKLVKMNLKFTWSKITKQTVKPIKTDISQFNYPEKQKQYKEQVIKNLKFTPNSTPQEKWTSITATCTSAAKNILGPKATKHKINDTELHVLADKKHKLRLKIQASKNRNSRENMRKERKALTKLIKRKISEHEKNEIEEKIKSLELSKNDSNRYYQVLRDLNRDKSKTPLYVNDKDGNVASTEKEQAEIITEHFQKMLAPDNAPPNNKIYTPHQMTKPFTANEIQKATQGMKNGKSSGIDEINAEHIKYAPTSIHNSIAEIFNTTAKEGNPPSELQIGILTPLPKPGKKKGPPENLRPIILLSVLRKILTICIMRRCWDRLSSKIPKDQAAYQGGRSAAEQVFTIKILAEKAITSSNYKLYILLLDMSKAFDTVNRNKLFEGLEEIMMPEELHILHILTNDVKIKVRVGSEYGEEFKTIIGIMQGDCLSAILFIFYLARALSKDNQTTNNIQTPQENTTTFTVQPKYADDITYASTSYNVISYTKAIVPEKLKMFNLQVNETKTEEYEVPNRDNLHEKKSWTKCKLLGSLLDTKEDIQHRKNLTINHMKDKKHIYKSKNLSIHQKIRYFKMFAGSIFLYHSELWALTKTLSDSIDAFHRRQLRYAIGIVYPRIISNTKLYELTKEEPWSKTIERRRHSWIGHLMRLDPEVPARKALIEALKPSKRKRGRPKTTWISKMQQDIKNLGLDITLNSESIQQLIDICGDRGVWRDRLAEYGVTHEVTT
jgi:exonuclease III